MTTFIAGFSLGLALILAIGAQNAFVLRQGIRREHVFLVSFLCAFSDALLIILGIAGFGSLVARFPVVEKAALIGGAVFLLIYGLQSLYSAWFYSHSLEADAVNTRSAGETALVCLAFTWLNPHVYLDTLVLLGSVSTQYQPSQWVFGAGAVCASFVFFFSLGYGARLLAPLFRKPQAWRLLDAMVGVLMLTLAAVLVL